MTLKSAILKFTHLCLRYTSSFNLEFVETAVKDAKLVYKVFRCGYEDIVHKS